MTSMRRTSMSKSSAPVDVSGGRARRPRHYRILAHVLEYAAQQPPGTVSAASRGPQREVCGDKHERCSVGGAREPRARGHHPPGLAGGVARRCTC